MPQTKSERSVAKVLHRFPEIVELTETRKRAIAGGRAGIEEALKSMVDADERLYDAPDYPGQAQVGTIPTGTPPTGVIGSQQMPIDQARYSVLQQQTIKGTA